MILYPAAMRNNLNQNLRSLLSLRFDVTGYEYLHEESAQITQAFPFMRPKKTTGGLRPDWSRWYRDREYGDLSYLAGDAPLIMEDFWKEARSYSVYFGTEEKPSDFNIFGQGLYMAKKPSWSRINPAVTKGHQTTTSRREQQAFAEATQKYAQEKMFGEHRPSGHWVVERDKRRRRI